MTRTLPGAYAFVSRMSLEEMMSTLNHVGTMKWRMRDSDSHGDYISLQLQDGLTRLRIFPHAGAYVLDIDWIYSLAGSMPREEVEEIIQRDVFPHIGASDVTPRESWD